MSNFGLNCDVCNRQNVGVTWVNGMKFCAKCYQETFGASKDWQLLDKDKTIAEQRKQIYDLEAKLAEKDLRIEELESQFAYECECNKQFVDCQKENTQLKQQLAEKDKWLRATDEHIGQLKKREQDKISFCIEQLEKVKHYAQHIQGGLINYIDNQIKQLKEMK